MILIYIHKKIKCKDGTSFQYKLIARNIEKTNITKKLSKKPGLAKFCSKLQHLQLYLVLPKMKHYSLNNAQRLEICLQKVMNPSITQSTLAKWVMEQFQLSKFRKQGTIINILGKRQQYESMASNDLTANH